MLALRAEAVAPLCTCLQGAALAETPKHAERYASLKTDLLSGHAELHRSEQIADSVVLYVAPLLMTLLLYGFAIGTILHAFRRHKQQCRVDTEMYWDSIPVRIITTMAW